ncbi:hypothetical protein, partial [Salmonella enterica]|uniref:hypothetical protein n=1 Tax=Salmonella enterica TaxID=28901 RepID=UPI001C2F96F8
SEVGRYFTKTASVFAAKELTSKLSKFTAAARRLLSIIFRLHHVFLMRHYFPIVQYLQSQ